MRRHREAESTKTEKAMRDYKNSEMSDLIDEFIHNDKHRRMLKRRLIDGICYEPLAEEFEMSVRQTKTIIYREQEKLFRHLYGDA